MIVNGVEEMSTEKLAALLKSSGAITFQISDGLNKFTVLMCMNYLCVGEPIYNLVFVGLLGYGCLQSFELMSFDESCWEAISEKMHLHEEAAKLVAREIGQIIQKLEGE